MLIWMNPAGQPDNQNELRSTVETQTRAPMGRMGMCLCFFGLCRNSLWKIDHLGHEVGVPMMIFTDINGNEVDDFFGAKLGGKKEYLDAIVHNRGTIFVSPGYAENWHKRQNQKPLEKANEQVENMRFVFEHMDYSRVMRLENGLGDPDKFDHRVDAFAEIFDFEVISRTCSLEVFEHSFSLAKERLAEVWSSSSAALVGSSGPHTTVSGHIPYRYR
jgi:hypothetical protein